MTALKDAIGRVVVGKIRPADDRAALAPPRPANANDVAVPILPDDLQHQVDRLIGRRFGDFVLSMPDGPVFHPDAARFAEQQRLATAPASEGAIRKWFMVIVQSLAPGPVDADAVFVALLLTCGDYPAACWQRATAAAIVGKERFLPLAAEIKAVVQPIADRLRGTLRALERIAGADPATVSRFHAGPAREAFGYDPGPAAPEHAPHPSMPKHEPAGDLVRIDPAEVARQLAALGVAPPPRATPDKPVMATVNRAPIAKPEASPLPPVRRRRR